MAKIPFSGVVSSVVAQAKVRRHLGQRVNVFIGEKFSFALDARLAMDRGLRPGMEITPETLHELVRDDGDARALATALTFLGYRMRSRDEVQKRLARDEWPDEVIARVLDKLASEGALNDANFAGAWVESRGLSRPRGARVLRQELRQKGVPRETIDAALPDEEIELDNAVEAARRKWYNLESLDERTRRDKMYAFLQRRGFNFSVSKAALARLVEEENEGA